MLPLSVNLKRKYRIANTSVSFPVNINFYPFPLSTFIIAENYCESTNYSAHPTRVKSSMFYNHPRAPFKG
uniref:Uncharacterized protein n=1 Tax=Wuchereria bancrofti TaxID=6293 RepID=A0AAF5PL49_WUCBA